jgi:hypothetical protein
MPYDLKFIFDIPYDRNDYVGTSCPDAPISPHLPILRCEHHKEAYVKQSRHPSMTTRDYYYCPYKSVSNNISHVWILCNLTLISLFLMSKQDRCRFFQWIDDPEMFDPQILFHPYDRNEYSPLISFKRWVPPPLNPLLMIGAEKDEASTHRICNPPACKCGYRAELEYPPVGLGYTPFFHCPIPLTAILHKSLYHLLWSKYWVYAYDIDISCVL